MRFKVRALAPGQALAKLVLEARGLFVGASRTAPKSFGALLPVA